MARETLLKPLWIIPQRRLDHLELRQDLIPTALAGECVGHYRTRQQDRSARRVEAHLLVGFQGNSRQPLSLGIAPLVQKHPRQGDSA